MKPQYLVFSLPLCISPVFAHEAAELAPVVVSATRFEQIDSRLPANITVISAQDIRQSPASNLPDLLKTQAGIGVSALYGGFGIDASVDLRGFGPATASLNTLILLDGQRLNPAAMESVNWSLIPLNNIERIEIMRGSGTVLYGDGASGGVVNIITKKATGTQQNITLGTGSNGLLTADAQLSARGESAHINLAGHFADTNGWRQNSAASQTSLAGRVGIDGSRAKGFVDFSGFDESARLPGALSQADYDQRPRYSKTPQDHQHRDGFRIRPGVEAELAKNLLFNAEFSFDQDNYDSYSGVYRSTYEREKEHWSFTPRLRWAHGLPGLAASETVIGFDQYHGDWRSVSNSALFGLSRARAEQDSQALYLQNLTHFDEHWGLMLGARSQRMWQSAADSSIQGETQRTKNAGEIGLSYAGSHWQVYGKAGTTFRFANTDELFGYDIMTGNSVFSANLRPQHGTIKEIGASARRGDISVKAAAFDMKLTDEILFDSNVYTNINTDPTQRRGIELEAQWQATPSLSLRGSYTYLDASFRSGSFTGKQIPMVAENKGALALQWNAQQFGQYSATVNYVGERYVSGDYANTLKQVGGYTTTDLMAAWKFSQWTIAAKVLNAFDKKYANWATYQSSAAYGYATDYYYYPADGRSFVMTARYDFK